MKLSELVKLYETAPITKAFIIIHGNEPTVVFKEKADAERFIKSEKMAKATIKELDRREIKRYGKSRHHRRIFTSYEEWAATKEKRIENMKQRQEIMRKYKVFN